jgi:putative tricarboxylic transport membrane protein
MIKGVTPGPFLIKKSPEIFWGIVGSMYIGNVMLLILNLPLIGLWVKILKIPYAILFPLIYLFCLVGSYILNNNSVDVLIMVAFGVIGYFMKKLEYPSAPLILAFILGPQFERYLGQSLIEGDGNPLIFFSRPISAILLSVAFIFLVSPFLLKRGREQRQRLSKEAGDDLA